MFNFFLFGYFNFENFFDLIMHDPKVPEPPSNKMLPFKKTPAIYKIFIFWKFNIFI